MLRRVGCLSLGKETEKIIKFVLASGLMNVDFTLGQHTQEGNNGGKKFSKRA